MNRSLLIRVLFLAFLGVFLFGCKPKQSFLNVSYDPTRELYADYNKVFAEHWKEKTGEKVDFYQSNGGSGSQAQKVIGGLEADVVTLALAYDIDNIGVLSPTLIPEDWQKRFPHNSCPYTSTIVFLVRKGNPKGIKDWEDLLQPEVRIITPDPKTSGGARWNYLAAWGFMLKKELGDFSALNDPAKKEQCDQAQEKAFTFVKNLFNNDKAPIKDSGARQSTNTFVQKKQGDVLLAWENEALYFLETKEGAELQVVVPSISILAEPPVAIIEKNAAKKGHLPVAKAYLEYLYQTEGQEICAKHFYRPSDPEIAKKYGDRFVHVDLFSIDQVFGGWANAQKVHFDDGGTYDRIGKKETVSK